MRLILGEFYIEIESPTPLKVLEVLVDPTTGSLFEEIEEFHEDISKPETRVDYVDGHF
jgi:hypothetical protein